MKQFTNKMIVKEFKSTFKCLSDGMNERAKIVQKCIYKYRLIKKIKALNHYYNLD